MAGAGLFDSILNVQLSNYQQIRQAIVDVWTSIYTERGIISRKQFGIKNEEAFMSVLIQEQIHSDLSFIIHTQNPISKNTDEVYIEVAVGLGETLASANQQGTPYRLIYNKKTQNCEILAFANYSQGLFANLGSN